MLPPGARLLDVSTNSDLPFLLYLPDADGVGVTEQWPEWSEAFELVALQLDPDCNPTFSQLSSSLADALALRLGDVPPERPVYILGEGLGAVLALALCTDDKSKRLVNRLIMVNPSTSYLSSPLARIAPLLERLPADLLAQLQSPPTSLQLPGLPAVPLPLPPPPPLPLLLGPLLGTSPQAVASQLLGSLTAQQPDDAVKALRSLVDQAQQLAARLPPATLASRLRMLEQGIKHVEPLLPDVSQRAMLLAGGRDVVLDSAKEADRLAKQMQRAFKRVLPDAGHALLREPGGSLLPLLRADGFYTTTRRFSSPVRGAAAAADVNTLGVAGPVEVPSAKEVARYAADWTKNIRELNSPVFLSTRPDGSVVLGLDALPDRRPANTHSQHQAHGQSQGDSSSWTERDASAHWAQQAANGNGNGNGHAAAGGAAGGAEAEAAAVAAAVEEAVKAGTLPDGPLLFVGNHQLYAFDMWVMVEEVLLQRGILMRGLAHPGLFVRPGRGQEDGEGAAGGSGKQEEKGKEDKDDGPPMVSLGNVFQTFGAVKVTPTAMYRLLNAGEAVLLYPGGVREGFKRRNEKYELFWPERSEFVRMAARFGATIIPVSAVGLEDSLLLLADSDDIRSNPLLGRRALEQSASTPRARVGVAEDASLDETFIPPIIAPTLPPARFYFLFGKPIPTSRDMYKDREACDKVYAEVKQQVAGGIDYLLRKRETDPYADFVRRMAYENAAVPFGGKRRQAPTFNP